MEGNLPPASASLWPPGRHTSIHMSGTTRMERRRSLWFHIFVCAYLIRPIIRAVALVWNAVFDVGALGFLVDDVIRALIRAMVLVWNAVVLLWISSLFSSKVHTTAHTRAGLPRRERRRTICCLWLNFCWSSTMPYDQPYDHCGRMKGRLLICFFRNFTFSSVIPAGLVPTQHIGIFPGFQTSVRT